MGTSEAQPEAPLYAHDCAGCTFLGRWAKFPRGSADLYHCMQGGRFPTVIARWSSNGADYSSGLVFAEPRDGLVPIPALGEAKRRAVARGLSVEGGL